MLHTWETTRCSRYVQRDECLRCGARRSRDVPDWQWAYLRGNETCKPTIDPSPDARLAVYRAVKDGADTLGKLRTVTGMENEDIYTALFHNKQIRRHSAGIVRVGKRYYVEG